MIWKIRPVDGIHMTWLGSNDLCCQSNVSIDSRSTTLKTLIAQNDQRRINSVPPKKQCLENEIDSFLYQDSDIIYLTRLKYTCNPSVKSIILVSLIKYIHI